MLQHILSRVATRSRRLRLLYHTAIHGNTRQHAATHCNTFSIEWLRREVFLKYCDTRQHTTTCCNTLQHAATHYNMLQHTALHCNTLQHTVTHCNTLQHTATHCSPHLLLNLLERLLLPYTRVGERRRRWMW